jgi:hypothetical protein
VDGWEIEEVRGLRESMGRVDEKKEEEEDRDRIGIVESDGVFKVLELWLAL